MDMSLRAQYFIVVRVSDDFLSFAPSSSSFSGVVALNLTNNIYNKIHIRIHIGETMLNIRNKYMEKSFILEAIFCLMPPSPPLLLICFSAPKAREKLR